MTAVYAVVLALGLIGLLVWIALAGIADTVEGWEHVDPERRFGPRARSGLAASLGFGMAGMSSTFAGWPGFAAFAGAVAGAVTLVGVATYFGPRSGADAGEDPEAIG